MQHSRSMEMCPGHLSLFISLGISCVLPVAEKQLWLHNLEPALLLFLFVFKFCQSLFVAKAGVLVWVFLLHVKDTPHKVVSHTKSVWEWVDSVSHGESHTHVIKLLHFTCRKSLWKAHCNLILKTRASDYAHACDWKQWNVYKHYITCINTNVLVSVSVAADTASLSGATVARFNGLGCRENAYYIHACATCLYDVWSMYCGRWRLV